MNNKHFTVWILSYCLYCSLNAEVHAQEDSIRWENETQSGVQLYNKEPEIETFQSKDPYHSPRKATIYSAILPGLGQAYNEKYWKIPIIYAGAAGVAYSITFNHKNYLNFRNALFAERDGDPNTINPFRIQRNLTEEQINRRIENFRRDREYSIVFGAVLYALNIVDALVDAHLREFDLSEDLSIKFGPTMNHSTLAGLNAGFGLTLKLKN